MSFLKTIVRIAPVLLFCAAPRLVEAQAPLGGENVRPLSVSASTFAGYDTDITSRGARPSTIAPAADRSASHAGASLTMSYGGGSQKLNYYTMGSTEYRYYRATDAVQAPMASGGAGVGLALGRRLSVNGSLQSTYFPRFQLSVMPPTTDIPIDQPQPTQDFGITSFDTVSYGATTGASYQLSTRSSLRANYSRSQYKYVGQDYTLSSHSVGAGYSRNLTRYATMQLGYSELGGNYDIGIGTSQPTVRRRTIDAGINYSRPLSISRRTKVGFTTGSTALDNGSRTFYTVTGNANLNHQLGRTWNLGVAYSRRVGLVGGFTEPIFSDATSANIGGLLGKRVSVSASVGYANGKVGLATRGRNYNSLQSNAGFNVGISRRISLFGSYFYYRHIFEGSVTLPLGLTPHVSRHGVRTGLSLRIY